MACTGCNGGCNDCGGLECGTGAAGLDGLNSFTTTTATFLQPAFGDPAVSVAVSALGQSTGLWGQVGQWIFIEGAGFFKIVTSTTTLLTVIVPSATIQTYNYTLAGSGATIAIGEGVSPAGIEGATGAAGAASTVAGPIGPANPAVLEVDFTEQITAQTSYSAVQKSFAVPADTWETVDDVVRLECLFVATDSTTGYYTIRVELDSNVVDMIITFNDLWLVGKQNFLHLTVDFVLSASGQVTPIIVSDLSTGAPYANNQSGATPTRYIRRCSDITGLTTSGALDIDVSMVSSAGSPYNIKMFYYKLISMKK